MNKTDTSCPVLVIGATGFIGRRVCSVLLRQGEAVRALVRNPKRLDPDLAEHIDVMVGDARDPEILKQGIEQASGVIHLAGPSGWDGLGQPSVHRQVISLAEAFDSALEVAPELPAVYVSTGAALGPCGPDEVIDEQCRNPIPRFLGYARAKREAEDLLLAGAGKSIRWVYPGEVYGPGDRDQVTLSGLKRLLGQRPRVVPAGGTGVVHLDDVADGIVRSLFRGQAGRKIILSGQNLRLREIGDVVLEWSGQDSRFQEIPAGIVRWVARTLGLGKLALGADRYAALYGSYFWFFDNSESVRALGMEYQGAKQAIFSALDWGAKNLK